MQKIANKLAKGDHWSPELGYAIFYLRAPVPVKGNHCHKACGNIFSKKLTKFWTPKIQTPWFIEGCG